MAKLSDLEFLRLSKGRKFLYKLGKFFASIPPVVYVPYGIALLPTLRSVSIFVIFLAGFWPIFGATMRAMKSVTARGV